MKYLRKAERFEDFGRVESEELCIVSGILEDISKTGLKVSYSVPPTIDMEKEYEINLRLSRISEETLSLMVKPVRFEEIEDKTEVGFLILHSKDLSRLESYISLLTEDSKEDDAISFQNDEDSLFI